MKWCDWNNFSIAEVFICLSFGFAVMWMQRCWLALRFLALICNLWRFSLLIAQLIGLLGKIRTFVFLLNIYCVFSLNRQVCVCVPVLYWMQWKMLTSFYSGTRLIHLTFIRIWFSNQSYSSYHSSHVLTQVIHFIYQIMFKHSSTY